MSEILTIVTINYNNAQGLQKTIASVTSQTRKDFEYIVIDGGSTDGSKEIIESYSDNIHYWISEKDSGIYNAQNKGMHAAKGEYMLFLNSGDCLINETILQEIAPSLNGTDIIYGDLQIEEENKKWIKKYNEPVTFGYFFNDTLPHQGSFIKRSILMKTGFAFDEELKIIADWKFFLEATCRYNATLHYLNKVVCAYDLNGISASAENIQAIIKEKHQVLKTEFPRFYEEYINLVSFKNKTTPLTHSRVVKFYIRFKQLIKY